MGVVFSDMHMIEPESADTCDLVVMPETSLRFTHTFHRNTSLGFVHGKKELC